MNMNTYGFKVGSDDSACKKTECRHETMAQVDLSMFPRGEKNVVVDRLVNDIWLATRALHWSTIDGFRADAKWIT